VINDTIDNTFWTVQCNAVHPGLPASVSFVRYPYASVYFSVLVGPCHHGMARPQVADRGTASDKEGSCE
jgi:hypothetical protein